VVKVEEVPAGTAAGALGSRFRDALAHSSSPPQLGFHFSDEDNIDSICENGIDPQRRSSSSTFGAGDYFAEALEVGLPYVNGGTVDGGQG